MTICPTIDKFTSKTAYCKSQQHHSKETIFSSLEKNEIQHYINFELHYPCMWMGFCRRKNLENTDVLILCLIVSLTLMFKCLMCDQSDIYTCIITSFGEVSSKLVLIHSLYI